MRVPKNAAIPTPDLLRRSAEVLAQRRFISQLRADYRRMRENPAEWASYIAERDSWLLGHPRERGDDQ